MGGQKRKIEIAKVEKTNSRAVTHVKRRKGLYSKASKLCLLSGAQIAVLATPVSSNSNVSFYSFGHSSVDSVVSAFLANQRPPPDDDSIRRALGFWWEDEKLAKSEDSNELSDAIHSIARMLQNLKGLQQTKAVENHHEGEDVALQGSNQEVDQDKTLTLQSTTCASNCIDHEGLKKEEDAVLDGSNQEVDQNQTLTLQSTTCASNRIDQEGLKKEDAVLDASNQEVDQNQTLNLQSTTCASNCIDQDDSPAKVEISQGENPISDNDNNNSLPINFNEWDEEFDLDEIFDLLATSEGVSMNSDVSTNQIPCTNFEVVEDGATMLIHGDYI